MVVGVLSAFINNTAAVTVFMPVAIHLANHFRFSPSKILLPLSYTAIIGGTCTLIGTRPTSSSARWRPRRAGAFSVFEFFYLGAILFVVGLVYNMLVPMRSCRRAITSSLTRKYHLSDYLTELKVPSGSKLVGRTVLEEHISERTADRARDPPRRPEDLARHPQHPIKPGDDV